MFLCFIRGWALVLRQLRSKYYVTALTVVPSLTAGRSWSGPLVCSHTGRRSSTVTLQGRSLQGFIIPTAGTGGIWHRVFCVWERETVCWGGSRGERECMWQPWLSWLERRERGWNRFIPRLVALHAFTHTHIRAAVCSFADPAAVVITSHRDVCKFTQIWSLLTPQLQYQNKSKSSPSLEFWLIKRWNVFSLPCLV